MSNDEIVESVLEAWSREALDEIVEVAVNVVASRVGMKLTDSDLLAQIKDSVEFDFELPERIGDGVYGVTVVAYLITELKLPVVGEQLVTVEMPIRVEVDVRDREVISWEIDTDNLFLEMEGAGVGLVPTDEPTALDPDEVMELARSWGEENLGELVDQFAEGILQQYPIARAIFGDDLVVEVRDNLTLSFGVPDDVEANVYRVPVTLTLEEDYDAPVVGTIEVLVSQTIGVDVDVLAREVKGWLVLIALTVQTG